MAAAADGPVVPAGPDAPGVTVGAGQAVDQPGGAPPDWPEAQDDPPPAASSATDRVVLRGDCLWDIAAGWLTAQRSAPDAAAVSDAEVLAAVQAWWQTNAAVIGPDPDLLLPGQVLTPPAG